MRAKYARLIRIGIMAKCLPFIHETYINNGVESWWEVPDYTRLRRYQRDYYNHIHSPLVQEAYRRTITWHSKRRKS